MFLQDRVKGAHIRSGPRRTAEVTAENSHAGLNLRLFWHFRWRKHLRGCWMSVSYGVCVGVIRHEVFSLVVALKSPTFDPIGVSEFLPLARRRRRRRSRRRRLQATPICGGTLRLWTDWRRWIRVTKVFVIRGMPIW